MIFRIYHITKGGHVHLRWFSGRSEGALGCAGYLVMRIEEFDAFKAAATFVQFKQESLKHD